MIQNIVNKQQMSKRIICESGLRWILNYRRALKSNVDIDVKRVADDGHSGGSWAWTRSQSNLIDKLGWDHWYNKTSGPEGYGVRFAKLFEKKLE